MKDFKKVEKILNKYINCQEYRSAKLIEILISASKGNRDALEFINKIMPDLEVETIDNHINQKINIINEEARKKEKERQLYYEKYMQEEAKRQEMKAKSKAEQVILMTENAIKALRDKVSDEDKKEAEALINDLMKVIETHDVENINAAKDKLLEKANELSKRVSEEIRKTEEKRLKEIEKVKKAKGKELKKQKESELMKKIIIESNKSVKNENKDFLEYKELYFKDIKLPNQEFDIEQLVKLSRKGNKEAKDIAGLALFKKTYEIAKEFSEYSFDIEFEDLLQEAMIGLNDYLTENNYAKIRNNNEVLEVISKELTEFEKTIICAITDGIKYSSQYGISNKELAKMILYRKISESLSKELKYEPTNTDISEEGNWFIQSVNYTNKLIEPNVSINSISEEELVARSPDYDISDTNTEEKVMRKIEYEIIYQILEEIKVSEHNKEIFVKLFTEELTLEEAGKEFDITKERVRQIEAKVLRNIRGLFEKQKYKYKRDYRPLLVKKFDYYECINGGWRPKYKYEHGLPYKTIDSNEIKQRIKTNKSYHYYK